MAVFQAMIGNHDYTVGGSHNVKWFSCQGNPLLVPVPYDFDFCGFVNAEYARPLPDYRQLQQVTDRMYLGRAQNRDDLEAALALVRSHREELLRTVEEFEPLSRGSRRHLVSYLEQFLDRATAKGLSAGEVLRY